MANQEVGSAYLEVEAKLKDGGKSLKREVEGIDVKGSGKRVGEGVGDGIGVGVSAKAVAIGNIVANVVTAAAKKAAQLVGSVIGGAFENYANWEQLTGGVEKLFGDASGQLMDYANQAFATAGLSANDYMETVTSFSASMISSLGGDTAKAAEYADQAIRDMSDNANVFGTDMGELQRAYQSMARGNYGMLDSLKLGYGGTKTEMERLLRDAEAISGVHYELGNFADVTEAIHVMQTEMSITGTTFREGATTIEGSMNQLKASWENWLTAVGGGGDLTTATDNLVSSLSTMLQNAVPRLGTIIGNLIKGIPDLVATFLAELPSLATNLVTALFGEDAGAAVAGVFDEIAPHLDGLIAGVQTMFTDLQPFIQTMAPALQQFGGAMVELIKALMDSLGRTLPYITSFLNWVAPYVAAFFEKLAGFIDWFVSDETRMNGSLTNLMLIVEAVGTAFGNAVTFIRGVWDALVEFFRGIPSKIQGFFATIGTWFSTKFGEVKQAIVDKFQEAVDFVRGIPETILGFFQGIGQSIGDFFGDIHIPLPYFAINPPGWQFGDLLKGSIPSLSVEWHASGGIVDGATLIGAGEAGREAIVPLENRNAMQPFAAAVSDDMQADGTFADMLAVLKQIRDKNTDIYMDSEKVGRALTPAVNRGIGNRAVMSSRGAAYAF